MRNLAISSRIALDFKGKDLESMQVTVNDENDLISYKDGILFQHSKENDETEIFNFCDTFVKEQTNVINENVSSMVWLSDGRIVISFKSGLLMSYDFGVNLVEVVGSFPTGLQTCVKSPDDELLLLVSNDGAIILMTARDFEPLIEFDPEDATNAAFANVNVGWGAKETQFHGKAGKAAREISQEVPEEVKEIDDDKTKVVWRDDGQYFAVNYVSKIDRIRRIRVFNREGQLQSTSEPVKSLGSCLAWKSLQGAIIASSMKMPNGKDAIGFFEKNGLRRGEFYLQKPVSKVLKIEWNSDSTIFAVHFRTENDEKIIQLWTSSNYKWQLKKEWNDSNIKEFLWDPISSMTFYIIKIDEALKYELKWKIHKSQGLNSEDLSYVAIIDGPILKVTPFREMIVPPPISAFELHHEENIKDIVFSSFNDSNSMIVLTTSLEAFIYDINGLDEEKISAKITGAGGAGFVPKCTTLKLVKKVKIQTENQAELYNFCWNSRNSVWATSGQLLHQIDLQEGKIIESLMSEDCISNIVSWTKNDSIISVLTDGSLLGVENSVLCPLEKFEKFPKPCSYIQMFEDFVIGLDEKNQRLYINSKGMGEISRTSCFNFLNQHFYPFPK